MMKVALLVIAAVLAPVVHAAVSADEITSLPQWSGPLPSKMYSGYLQISNSKFIHYVFVTSQNDAANDPVVLWLNGGPGCSSLDGYFYEHGPFRMASDSSGLMRFNATWASVANMLYLEAPVGVGFSYSTNPKDYQCTDDTTAADNLAAVEKFFQLYPEFKVKANNQPRDFFLTGESYAGVYVPTLAEAIVFAVGNGTYTGAPLRGIAVGNGCTGTEIGVCGGERDKYETEYLLGTAFIDPPLKDQIRASCNWTRSSTPSAKCAVLLDAMHQQIGHIDLYNMYGSCISGSGAHQAGSGSHTYKAPLGPRSVNGPDACIDSILASNYFNRKDVQTAFHVRAPTEPWSVCGQEPGWSYQSTRPNLPRDTYPRLIANFPVTIYNGDWDSCVPYTDNYAWTLGMNYPVKSSWHPWQYAETTEGQTSMQVGGYAIVYQATNLKYPLTFTTVRGGRHEVPMTAPLQALNMLQRVINGTGF